MVQVFRHNAPNDQAVFKGMAVLFGMAFIAGYAFLYSFYFEILSITTATTPMVQFLKPYIELTVLSAAFAAALLFFSVLLQNLLQGLQDLVVYITTIFLKNQQICQQKGEYL